MPTSVCRRLDPPPSNPSSDAPDTLHAATHWMCQRGNIHVHCAQCITNSVKDGLSPLETSAATGRIYTRKSTAPSAADCASPKSNSSRRYYSHVSKCDLLPHLSRCENVAYEPVLFLVRNRIEVRREDHEGRDGHHRHHRIRRRFGSWGSEQLLRFLLSSRRTRTSDRAYE